MNMYAHRPRLTPESPYFPAIQQAQHAAKRRHNSAITTLGGSKCRSEAHVLLEARDRYPVYVQKVTCGNPHKEVRVDGDYEMAVFLQRVLWGHSYVVVRPVAPVVPQAAGRVGR